MTDLRPLRQRGFRRVWLSATATGLSGQLAATALLVQVQVDSGSVLLTGLAGALAAVATVAGNLVGGALADRCERRRVVLACTVAAAGCAAALALVAGSAPLPVLLTLVAAQTLAGACGAPARRTFLRRVLPAADVPAGVALLHLSFQVGLLAGPAVGALLLSATGPSVAYGVDAAAALVAVALLRGLPAHRSPPRPPPRWPVPCRCGGGRCCAGCC
ncbi:MFS transporter [Kineococcus sp. SYSU DK003]|uniref:MFS transporter n=1 Tax=Kineococcus sp. SYSU DK003 TaxID=3383124 RepID=UPI003D7E85F7